MPETGCRVEVTRCGRLESLHHCAAVVCAPSGEVVAAYGDWQRSAYLRSCGKFLQAAILPITGSDLALALDLSEIAIACGSHGARPDQLAAIRSLLAKAGLDESFFQCKPHPPLEESVILALARAGLEPTAICNNCSGKHASMLAVSKLKGWPLETYMRPDHPVQQLALRCVAEFCGLAPEAIPLGVDGCGVPVFWVSLGQTATGFARFASGEGLSEELASAASRLRQAISAYPELTTTLTFPALNLMQATGCRVLSKGGAEGLIAAGDTKTGLGFAVKALDGSHRASGPMLLELIKRHLDLPEETLMELAPIREVILQEGPEGPVAEAKPYLD